MRRFSCSVSLRSHASHASCPASSGGDHGLAAGACPVWPRPHGLAPAAWKQVHLEEGVSGCHGEVSWGWTGSAESELPEVATDGTSRVFTVCVCACSFFSDNQYPDEAKREEIAAACNSVIQKPGKLRQATYNAIIFREMKQTVACPCACVSSREEAV